jgi:hypothetical protein
MAVSPGIVTGPYIKPAGRGVNEKSLPSTPSRRKPQDFFSFSMENGYLQEGGNRSNYWLSKPALEPDWSFA